MKGRYEIHQGDCLDALRKMPDCSVDSIVTDPPYGLSFMGKKWDYDVPSVEVWAECLRVLKPGGHLLAFAGTRTQHRMAVRIEDAGFEIRDMIAWVYSTGFPKSMNLDRLKGDKICGCSLPNAQNGAETLSECNLRPVRHANVSPSEFAIEEYGEILQQSVPQQSASAHRAAHSSGEHEGREQSGMEGWSNAPEAQGELCSSAICESTGGCKDHGQKRRLCDGASMGDGAMDGAHAYQNRSRAPRRPQSTEQQSRELGAMAGQPQPQAMGAWPLCSGCGLPRVPNGLGTALKPALEPITVARKPLGGRTVAENVLAHGTGAINVDGCRVVGGDTTTRHNSSSSYMTGKIGEVQPVQESYTTGSPLGRWPANLIHDGSDDVLAGFPDSNGSGGSVPKVKISGYGDGVVGSGKSEYFGGERIKHDAGSGSAARFFYCAKASKKDRDEGLDGFEARPSYMVENGSTGRKLENNDGANRGERTTAHRNTHPTVKPTDLMRYLCRLVTPPGGTVLDPFMGSGSTGKAAMLEGFNFIGCELSAEYVEIAKARIKHALGQVEIGTAQLDIFTHGQTGSISAPLVREDA